MLMPRKTKFRRHHRGRRRGASTGQTSVQFGEYGLKALEAGWVTNRQIEAARIAATRKIRRSGKVWINLFPDKPVTKKPAETRMGSGKGSPEGWVAVVKPGRVMFELAGVDEPLAKEALRLAGPEASPQDQVRPQGGSISLRARELRALTDDELGRKMAETRQELFNLHFQTATGVLENSARLRHAKREIARILTVQNERERGTVTR